MSERRFAPSKMARLDNPERRKALPPEKILTESMLGPSNDVLDLGAGTGYFTVPAAKMTKGTVYALDVEPQMLDFLKNRVQEEQLTNVEFIQGVIEEIPMDNETVDFVIASFVLHEVEPLSKGVDEILRILKPEGRCVCIEWEKKQTEQGPPLGHRINSDDMKAAFLQKGFRDVAVSYPSDAHYIMIAYK
ncbi:class I SAM-dependent methyltransferase [Paenibacillus rigui]|uniref:SAM-dependent methyltransferase n=1 Tax=Paenibacillus rigui TaxID=554312 RepID=A0A229UJE0_9BACL|nr:class I SAM-dependent methyltransferase [Paenibacillus rigui]OXM83019.1 SAM-dependent methyltransferase [Paenibacillus rigui]